MSTKVSFSRKGDIFKLIVIFTIVLFVTMISRPWIKEFSGKVYNITITFEYFKTVVELSLIIFGILRGKALWNSLKSKFMQKDFKGTGQEFNYIEEKVKGIVIPVSRREQPEWIIRHLKPEYVAFLYTESSKEIAINLIRDFSDSIHFLHTVKEIEENIDMIKNPDDPLEVKSLTKKFIERFRKLSINNENIFVDTTGGKVPMSIGAFQAAVEMNVSSIYIVGKANGLIKDPTLREHGYPIFMSQQIT